MQINSAAQYNLSSSAHSAVEKGCDKNDKKVASELEEQKAVDTVEITETDDGKAAGVLKNLQEGHYKGVADVRLRINFADQIAALENAEAVQIAAEGTSAVVQNVTDQVSTLLQSDDLTDEQAAAISDAAAAFESSAGSSIESLTGSGNSPETTIEDIRSHFNALTEAITAATTTQIESDTIETTDNSVVSTIQSKNMTATNAAIDTLTIDQIESDGPVVTGDDAPEFSIESFLADLIDSFESAMQQLVDELESSSVLPEISEPNGKGKAYDKFMAIYNEINQPTLESSTEAEINLVL